MGLGGYHVAVLLSAGAMLVYLSVTKPGSLFSDYWALLVHLGEWVREGGRAGGWRVG